MKAFIQSNPNRFVMLNLVKFQLKCVTQHLKRVTYLLVFQHGRSPDMV